MAGAFREQTLSLIAAAKNHGDLAVKLSSLKQAKEILLCVEPSFAAEIFPYLTELQTSVESLVRKYLVELVEELGLKVMEQSYILMPVLLTLLEDGASVVVRQSIVSGTNFYCSILEKMALQFHQTGRVEKWLEELWMWMTKFKDVVCAIALKPGSVGTKLLAMKFLETYILLFTSDTDDPVTSIKEGKGQTFNISWVVGGHPILDPALFTLEANKALGLLLDQLQFASTLCGSLIISVINCLAAIARRRPLHYSKILSALLGFDPNFETLRGGHAASIQYSLRTAFLGFLRCTHPGIIESRERLLRALRAINAGDAADQVIRQVGKMIKNTERASRDARYSKEDQPSSPLPAFGDLIKKRPLLQDNDVTNTDEVPGKRTRYGPQRNSAFPGQIPDDSKQDDSAAYGTSPKLPLLDNDLTPVEQMIAMIGALLAQGERGAESLEILISKIHPDLLADIVIANMRHLPKNPPPLLSRLGNGPVAPMTSSSSTSTQVAPSTSIISVQNPAVPGPPLQAASQFSSAVTSSTSLPDVSIIPNLPADYKRDPRRDPRRLDPRRVAVPGGVQSSVKEETSDMQSVIESSAALSRPLPPPVVIKVESASVPLVTRSDLELSESSVAPVTDQLTSEENLEVLNQIKEESVQEVKVITTSDLAVSPVKAVVQDAVASIPTNSTMTEGVDPSCSLEFDQHSPVDSSTSASEETPQDFPLLPSYIELTEEQKKTMTKLAVERIIESCKQIQLTDCSQTRMALLTRLVAQMDADADVIVMLQKHIVLDYQPQKGHELVMHVLYHLHALMISESNEQSSLAATMYEKFLLAVARSLWDTLSASDKSFSRLLGEVPHLPDSALKMLEDLCYADGFCFHGKDARDGDRVTQGLGAVWSLILGRPPNRQACLNIALKCAVHSQDEVRAKAIRLVANKLYLLGYLSDSIEQFATTELLSVVDQHVPDTDPSPAVSTEQRTEGNLGTQETSISGSHNSEPGASESDSVKGSQPVIQSSPTVSLSQAQRHMSLFFALCTKKPSLLKLVFDIYGRAPKAVKQAVHRHIPILVRTLGPSYSELLHIISDPPQGSENLLMLVLQILTEETTPSADLIATVKHLYEAKLKDAAILIPMLSSLSKDEVLPIFPRLVDLPLEKFQAALARILQGSAHTGPALTPAEVLVAIHDINPDKDGIALKKIMDACSACFEQRTVFTQQVLAKALNMLVDQSPLPLLFMRTVIQAIDAFPTLVDFVMEILSKLVSKQIWKMPKLWVGFLKCASQTQPHSFPVLLQLPPPQLESALNKHANLRGPLAAHASQPSIRSSIPRSTLVVLGLANEPHMQRSYLPSLHASDTGSSVHGATLT